MFAGTRSPTHIWHSQLGHPSIASTSLVISQFKLPVLGSNTIPFCTSCQYGKLHKLHFSLSNSISHAPLDLIHLDVWGPAPEFSFNGCSYFVHFVDDFSRFTWIYPLKKKSDVLDTFINFLHLVENLFSRKIKMLQTDWGGEYRNFKLLTDHHGILYRLSCPHTSEQTVLLNAKFVT